MPADANEDRRRAVSSDHPAPVGASDSVPENEEEQMEAWEDALKNEDWGHQPCEGGFGLRLGAALVALELRVAGFGGLAVILFGGLSITRIGDGEFGQRRDL